MNVPKLNLVDAIPRTWQGNGQGIAESIAALIEKDVYPIRIGVDYIYGPGPI